MTQINKNRHGIWVVVLSIVVFLIAFAALTATQGGQIGEGAGYNY